MHNGEPTISSDIERLSQLLFVYHLDMLAEVEGQMRALTHAQRHLEKLRSGPAMTADERREPAEAVAADAKTLLGKLESLQDTLLEFQRTAEHLLGLLRGEGRAGPAAEIK